MSLLPEEDLLYNELYNCLMKINYLLNLNFSESKFDSNIKNYLDTYKNNLMGYIKLNKPDYKNSTTNNSKINDDINNDLSKKQIYIDMTKKKNRILAIDNEISNIPRRSLNIQSESISKLLKEKLLLTREIKSTTYFNYHDDLIGGNIITNKITKIIFFYNEIINKYNMKIVIKNIKNNSISENVNNYLPSFISNSIF